jgi:hypothetical protein
VAVFATSTNVTVAYDDGIEVYTARSTDSGASFGTPQRLDNTGLKTDEPSGPATVASDGAGNVWVAWLEGSAGNDAIAVRHSPDSGGTFDAVHRLNRDLPEGTLPNTFAKPYNQSAALPGACFVAWGGSRKSTYYDALVNAHDPDDFDRDQVASSSDCNDDDPGAFAVPGEVTGTALEKVAGTIRIAWQSQATAAGTGTVYDLVTGLMDVLRASGSYAAATCLADDASGTSYDDTRSGPDPLKAYYYLVRGQNSCGAGTYGDSSLTPDPRDDLDTSGPCP